MGATPKLTNLNDPCLEIFLVDYNADLQEGRGYQSRGILLVRAIEHHMQFAEHWCYENFGNRIGFICGVKGSNCLMPRWIIEKGFKYNIGDHKLLAEIKDVHVKRSVNE